eukprot:2517020-Amphidinium_carterae.1
MDNTIALPDLAHMDICSFQFNMVAEFALARRERQQQSGILKKTRRWRERERKGEGQKYN